MAPASCRRCGEILNANANFCWSCGAPQHATETPDTLAVPIVPAEGGGVGATDVVRGDIESVVVDAGHGEVTVVDLVEDETSAGRHDECDIALDDISVSRTHVVFTRTGSGRITVRDLNSLNGTYVNGSRVEESVLRDGDEIQIGKYKLIFRGKAS